MPEIIKQRHPSDCKDMEYDDIIDLPHPEPKYHARMLPYKRAAQFKAFMPLGGYAELLKQVEEENEAQSKWR